MTQEKLDQRLWLVNVRTRQGDYQTLSTQNIEDRNEPIDTGILYLFTLFTWNEYTTKEKKQIRHESYEKLMPNQWSKIFSFITGFDLLDNNTIIPFAQTAAALYRLQPKSLPLLKTTDANFFKTIEVKPTDLLIEAILHADEQKVLHIISVMPQLLLEEGMAQDYQGRAFIGTPLQAAIAMGDIALNKISTGLVEIIFECLQQTQPNNFKVIFEQQARAIYIKSLIFLCEPIKKINSLSKSLAKLDDGNLKVIIQSKIAQLAHEVSQYETSLESKNLLELFEAHNKAQEDNAFDFKPYVDAILDIDLRDLNQQKQLNDVMALIKADTPEKIKEAIKKTGVGSGESEAYSKKDFSELTLVQKLNRFRRKLVEHMRYEVIFNPNHILKALEQNEDYWDHHRDIQDSDDCKPTVIFSQLVGWAHRCASESMKQVLRQGSVHLFCKGERCARQVRFNDGDRYNGPLKRNLVFDGSIANSDFVGGIGYNYGVSSVYGSTLRIEKPHGVFYWNMFAWPPEPVMGFVQKSCHANKAAFSKFIIRCMQSSSNGAEYLIPKN